MNLTKTDFILRSLLRVAFWQRAGCGAVAEDADITKGMGVGAVDGCSAMGICLVVEWIPEGEVVCAQWYGYQKQDEYVRPEALSMQSMLLR